jgi:hypothetical protein
VLRFVLGQPDKLPSWSSIEHAVSSDLLRVECLRTVDRLRLAGHLDDEDLASRRGTVHRLLRAIDLVELSPAVLTRASQPFPLPLGTLDAIHLATALLWREQRGDDLHMATHGHELARAAEACGVPLVGGVW